MTFWRYNDVIITSCVRWKDLTDLTFLYKRLTCMFLHKCNFIVPSILGFNFYREPKLLNKTDVADPFDVAAGLCRDN